MENGALSAVNHSTTRMLQLSVQCSDLAGNVYSY